MDSSVDMLFDTNVLIYAAAHQEKYVRFIEQNVARNTLGASVLSYLEAMAGCKDPAEESVLRTFFSYMELIALDASISRVCLPYIQQREKRSVRDARFADIVIGCTALHLGVPLVTNNPKDFRMIKGLELLVP